MMLEVCVKLINGNLSALRSTEDIPRKPNWKSSRGARKIAYGLSDPATYIREVGAILEAADSLGTDDLTIITRTEERVLAEGGRRIRVIPAWKWFLRI